MNTSTLTVIQAALAADIPVLLWGPPGIGKSSMIRDVAHQMGLLCEVVIGSVREPSDFAGLPVVRDDSGEIPDVPMAPPDWARRLAAAGQGILFLDEISTAPPAVQAAMLRVVLDRAVGSLQLPAGIKVIAAGNPPDQAADGWELAAPLANRFLHLDCAADVEVFVAGMTAGWGAVTPVSDAAEPATLERTATERAMVAEFVRVRRELLHQMPGSEAEAGRAWPSPRTWEMVAHILPHLPDSDLARTRAVCGLVGEGAGVEFLAWRTNSDLPDPAAVLSDPTTMNWRDRPDRVYAVLSSLVAYFAGFPAEPAADRLALWGKIWDVLAFAAQHGQADIPATAARRMFVLRPEKAPFPVQAKAFLDVLRGAGLVDG